MADLRKQKKTSRLSVVISLVFHALIIGGLVFIAAREGMLGKELKKIAVTMVPKEKPPEEKPREKPPEEKPPLEEPKPEQPPQAQPQEQPRLAPPTTALAPAAASGGAPAAAPAAASLPAFDFEGGKAVETASDPNVIYKGYVEYFLRSRWIRPEGVDDASFVAEVELTVDPAGRIQGTTWKRGSGNATWDASVKRVLADADNIGRPPPKGFPSQVLVRFDVQTVEEIGIE